MKRSSLLFFALMLIFNFYSVFPAYSVSNLTNGVVQLLNDDDVNGYINRGDTIRITCTAVFVAPATAWLVAPIVDVSQLGLGNVVMQDLGGGNFRADIVLTNWNPAVNYVARTVSVYCRANDEPVAGQTISAAPTFDLCQVEGTGANAVNNVTLTNQARLGERLRLRITDNRYQTDPLGGTICTVNLTPVGGNATTPMSYVGGNMFEVLSDALPAGINYVGPLTITLNDPMLGHPAVAYQTNSVNVDTIGPQVDYTNTTVVIQSGNAIAIPGDVLRITGTVTAYDNETVTVTCADLTAPRANPALNAGQVLPLIISNGIGNPATWQLDVTLTEAIFKNPSVPFVFQFVDDQGNLTTVTRYISIDLEKPNFVNPTANVLFPDGSNSPNDVATTSCQLEFTATIPIVAPPDTLTVSIDLSPIGGSANYVMNRIGLSDVYRCVYILPQGALEDGVAYAFIVSARDLANNLIARATTPDLRIDNNPPVLSGAQLTAPTANITVGTIFTIQCTATGLETNGSVSVDLSTIGYAANENLPHVGSNIFRRNFTLLNASDPVVPGVVDGFTSFTIAANDTVMGGAMIGHLVTTTTNQMMIDNEPPYIEIATYVSQHILYPADALGYVRIGDTINFYAKVASAPISVKINMLNLGQGNSETMVPSTNPAYPSDENWYEYKLPGSVPEGLINRAAAQFRVTALDDANNINTRDISVPIDNVPIKTDSFEVSATYTNAPLPPDDTDPSIINLNKTVDFTVILSQPYTDLYPGPDAAAIIDLSKFGGQVINATMTYDPIANSYIYNFVNNIPFNYDSASHKFRVTIKDQSGNRTFVESTMRRVDNWRPTINSTNATILGGGASAKIGDTIRFSAEVINNENIAPVINLANLGLSSAQVMSLISSDLGVFTYGYDALIGAGTINSAATTWNITSRDNDLNYATALTPAITVDNVPPQLALNLAVTGSADPSIIRLGENITFTLELNPADPTIGTITVDMRSIGLGASETLAILGSTASRTVTTTVATAEFLNYRFTATVSDNAGNKITSNSNLFTEVDCLPVTFTNAQIVIWQDNGDNPLPGIAGINDVLMVYANLGNYTDAIASATIGSGTTDFATATMVFNSTRNRHEGLFTIKKPGVDGWGILAGAADTVYFKLSALDNVSNLTQIAPQVSTFTVRNIEPEISFVNIGLDPNRYRDFTGIIPIYNLGTDTVGDRLIASVTFANSLPMHRAWLDFVDLGSGTVELSVSGDTAVTSAAGIPVSKFASLNWAQKRVYLKAMDQAGNITTASQSFWIDNVAPALTSSSFDGKKLTVNLSEDFFNLAYRNFEIVGSNPAPLNTPVYLNFLSTAPTVLEDMTSFDITLAVDHMKEMAQWASTPIYLKVTNNIATAALTDLSGNSLPMVNFYPITITDSTWREPARVNQFTMTHNWPNTITLDFFFNKEMNPASVIASNAVLTFANLAYDFTSVDYSSGYVFQPADYANFTWFLSNTHLRVVMSDEGRDWIARKIGNGATQLRFATRSPMHIFGYDSLGKPMNHVPTSNPVIAADNRPTPGFDFTGPPAAPKLDLASRTLTLSANDRLLLSTSNFDVADSIIPQIGMPQPTNGTRVSSFFNKAVLHDVDSGNNRILELQPIDITINNEFASTTVTLKLTDNDLLNVFNLFKANATPIWRIAVGASAFTNLWGTPNTAYLPSGNPGAMNMVAPTGYTAAEFAACAMNDRPPVNQKLAGELIFDIEVFPPHIDAVIVPLQSQIAPLVRIVNQNTGLNIASGTYANYSERTVDGRLRSVFRFTNTTAFANNLQRVPARIEISGITDIFGNTYTAVSSFAYDLNTRNDAAVDGYNDVASVAIEIDTQKPVVSSIVPSDVIGRIPAGTIFKVNFNEQMDAAFIPTLTLTNGANIMNFTFSGWTATATADFTNNTAFTAALPQGIWYYQVTAGRDVAGNTHDGTAPNAFPVEVRTYAPEVTPGSITLRTMQNTISNAILVNQPWASIVGDGVFSIQYTNPPTLFLPHFLEIFDPSTNTRLGRTMIVSDIFSSLATATFTTVDFNLVYPGLTGPSNYATRIIDSAMNQTETISNLVYDNLAPAITSFNLTGIGSSTATTWYYRPTGGNFTANVVATTTDALRLAIYNHAALATSTQVLGQNFIPTTYTINTGSSWANGTYTLTIVDMAGNIGTGAASKLLVVDNAAPTVLSVTPADAIGNSPAGATQVRVTFSEAMDATAALQPTLSIATTSATIAMTFQSWVDPLVASTAIYVNTSAITSTVPVGTYTYRVTGGRDLAGNALTPTVDGTHRVMVYSDGPFARIDLISNQSHIYPPAEGLRTNYAFNPEYALGVATLTINYAGGPFTTPHNLQFYNSVGTLVGTYTGIPETNPAIISFAAGASYSWDIGQTPGLATNETYQFKIVDNMGTVSGGFLPNNLRYDTIDPDVTSIAVGLPGIATDTGSGLAWYYSPALGNATFTVNTSNNDVMRLLVLKESAPVATLSADMTSTNGFTHQTLFGSTLTSGVTYTVTAVDTAGNIAGGPASRAVLIADSVAPAVSSATPMLAGALATGTGAFDIIFSEHMNTAIIPTLQLATTSATIPMNFVNWVATDTVRFTNAVAIDSSFPVGSYSYVISGARDLAGNLNIVPASEAFMVQLFTTAPTFTAQLVSQQTSLFDTANLINRPFSGNIAPAVATLSITYAAGHPYQAPHSILLYRSNNSLASDVQILPSGSNLVTITRTLLDPLTATETYRFRLRDSIGNLSATSTLTIVYDELQPTINTATFANYSNAIASPLYYNEQLHGSLNTRFNTNASDSLLLVLSPISAVATATYAMISNTSTGVSSFSLPIADAAALGEGSYWITAADMAGNMADGAASLTRLVIDRTIPAVTSVAANVTPVASCLAGAASFTVIFNEHMNELASATPVLVLATTTAQIPCTFVRWVASDTAEFVNTTAITIELPQGNYDARVAAYDLTGNKLDTNNAGVINVRSRGPVVASFITRSFQSTTASSAAEILIGQPFSMNVAPGSSTMSIALSQAPDSTPVHLHWTLGGLTVASAPLSLVGNNATFTWDAATGPIPLPPAATTYVMRLADGNGDLSIESYSWRVDNIQPNTQLMSVTGGETATGAVYFSPSRHRYITPLFNAIESEAPKLRIRGTNSTDTYELQSVATNRWSCNFDGRYSRGTAPMPPMPDGTYALDMVDRAGNIATPTILFDVIIDSQAPIVTTYTMTLAGNPVTSFAPNAGNLHITAVSGDAAGETGIFWMEVLNSSGIRINRLPLTDNIGSFTAQWDGRSSDGNMVLDGYYSFRATDYAGNRAIESPQIFARTSPFKVTGATQISSTTAKIWFNHEIDAASIVGSPIVTVPGLAISNLTRSDNQAISFTVNPAFGHEVSYAITVASGTIRSVFGAAIQGPDNTTSLLTDGEGPRIVAVKFDGLAGQQEFKVEFNEAFKATTAGIAANYTLTGPSGVINVVQATTQSDLKTVLLTAATSLVENLDYTISAASIEDSFGNLSPVPNTLSFKGRDLTPPVLTVSAFSNPANENDIIVVVTSNELLKSSPTLQVAQSNAPVITTLMQQGAEPTSYMMGVHLIPSYPGNGTLLVSGEDLAGNIGNGNNTFTIAYVSSTAASQLISADSRFKISFNTESLKEDATVKILKHELSKKVESGAAIRTSLQSQLRAATSNLHSNQLNTGERLNHAELIPVSDAYEVGIAASKVNKGFSVSIAAPQATSTTGLGLFYQSGNTWKFLSADLSSERTFTAKTSSSQMFAIMRDIEAPRISMAAELDLNEPFRTARPEFNGLIEEAGAGLDLTTISAHIDGGPAQPVQVDENGNFVFIPMTDLVGGHHDLVIRASDRTGNLSQMSALRFLVVVPLNISQIMQYPNPASRKGFIRISANRGELNDDLVKVTIYDVAGHKVTRLDGVRAVRENWGVNSRFLYDIPWDLRNDNGKNVANGLYFARIEVCDPDNPSARIKKNFKMAVLR